MAASPRTARLFLLVTLVAGWAGSVLGVPVLLAFDGHGHGHELFANGTDGHASAVLHHLDTAVATHADAEHAEEAPFGGPVHPDHTVHLPELDPVVVTKPVPAPTAIVVLVFGRAFVPRARVSTSRPAPPTPVPDGPLDALRTTVLLV